jgi:hypothetical protein
MRRPLAWVVAAWALVVVLTSCGSGSRPTSRPAASEPVTALSPGSALAARARAREQDILAALPLARRVPRIILGKEGAQRFRFEGYYSGRELVCVKAMPPPEGDTTNIDHYFYDQGRLLGYTHEMRSQTTADGPPDLRVHALFGPDGTTLDFQMTVHGESHDLRPPQREALLRMTRAMAQDAYEEVSKHPDG